MVCGVGRSCKGSSNYQPWSEDGALVSAGSGCRSGGEAGGGGRENSSQSLGVQSKPWMHCRYAGTTEMLGVEK